MCDYIPDFHERGEARCEQQIEGDYVICACGALVSIYDIRTCSPDPYARGVCEDCYNDWLARTKA